MNTLIAKTIVSDYVNGNISDVLAAFKGFTPMQAASVALQVAERLSRTDSASFKALIERHEDDK